MGIHYQIINATRRERISFAHRGLGKPWEWALNGPAAAVATLYLIRHAGEAVAFVGDTGDWPFAEGSRDDLPTYRDVTRELLAELDEAGALDRLAGRYGAEVTPGASLQAWAPPASEESADYQP